MSIQLYTRELMRQMALMSLFTEQADQQQAQKEAEEKDEVDGRSAAVAAPAAASTCATAGSTLHEADCPAPQCHGHMIKVSSPSSLLYGFARDAVELLFM